MNCLSFPLSARLLVILGALPLADLRAQGKGDVTPNDPDIVRVTPTPTVIEKFTALQMRMEGENVDWAEVFSANQMDFDPDAIDDKDVHLPVALGIRMTDGIIAIMGKNSENLNSAAEDIEKMARKLGVGEKELSRAKQVKAFANRNAWNRVYMELGWLQRDVMATLDREGNKDRRALLLSAGWLQGAHITSSLVAARYNEDRSTLVREPILIKQMALQLEAIKGKQNDHPIYKSLLTSMNRITPLVDVPVGAAIPRSSLEQIRKVTADFRATTLPQE